MSGNINSNDITKSSSSYEDFINENILKNSQKHHIDNNCDENKFKEDCDDKSSNSDIKDINSMQSESEDESEIDLTTTSSPNDNFTLVNGCIDFSSNNNNSDK